MLGLSKWQMRAILSMAILACTWGLWDTIDWVSKYPGQKFPLPFTIMAVDWWIAADLFAGIIAFCLVYMFVIQKR
jgi:hypothetical protein